MLSKDSDIEEIMPIAMVIHELLGLPVTMKSLNKRGVRIEKGKVIDNNYTGPVLEQSLRENRTIRVIPKSGAYSGIPVVVSPIRDNEGSPIVAIGIVDVIGTIDLVDVFGNYPDIIDQVQSCLKRRSTIS